MIHPSLRHYGLDKNNSEEGVSENINFIDFEIERNIWLCVSSRKKRELLSVYYETYLIREDSLSNPLRLITVVKIRMKERVLRI